MATNALLEVHSFVAEGSLATSQFLFVKIGTLTNAVVLCGDGGDAIGVLQNKPADTKAAEVAVLTGGRLKVICAEAIAVGARISSDAAGKAVASASGDFVLGRAVVATANASELVEFVSLVTAKREA